MSSRVPVQQQKVDRIPTSFAGPPKRLVRVTITNGIDPFDGLKNVLVCGKTGSGKTNAIRCIIKANQHLFKHVVLICGSSSADTDYKWIPASCKFEWSSKIIQNLMEHQNKRRRRAERKGKTTFSGVCVILDDIIGTVPHNDKVLNSMLSKCRHYNIMTIVAVQRMTAVAPTVRDNVYLTMVVKAKPAETIKFCRETCGINEFQANSVANTCKDLWSKPETRYTFLYHHDDLTQDYAFVQFPLVK